MQLDPDVTDLAQRMMMVESNGNPLATAETYPVATTGSTVFHPVLSKFPLDSSQSSDL
jgi:hypothetical protein